VSARTSLWIARADRASLAGMGLGLALMLLVDGAWAFRTGFFVVLASTVAQIVFSHWRGGRA
jgi:hypothetical protein